ncbi:motility associated factor glycosyltransferase family protein [Entomospira culicis]|uniref:Motility associated factor glycosyltransferase family protein n=1 Tax=Entomospira culicis TaxID=2719989 RepID=A0A968GHA3_9SPIO|nr:6-hydroxymethylpterin diphosphokinase MptE-like protein [Entomospira culicis]NIZ19269.1 motility associated factor glycosyltransferase family protein [Entomospira culicis]NIZ69826.1 motility associated factor glycosyltransferase family protein [Entomospira culicis]WDI36933.1 DUF115 domain-containing protein [Entomospira culicis]WDI38562.1 DUF115 domain-containing protein [Entomospira culicis]
MKPSLLDQFAQRFPALDTTLNLLPPDPQLVLTETKSELPTLIAHGLALHSRYDPQREASKELTTLPDGWDTIILAGVGLGYFAQAVIRTYPERKIIILEPNLAYLNLLRQSPVLTDILKHPQLAIIPSSHPADLQHHLIQWQAQQPHWHEFRARVQQEPDRFAPFKTIFLQYQQRQKTNQLALQQYGLLWWRNSIKNLPHWASAKPVKSLFDAFHGLPVLIVAAGPSLANLLPHLTQLRERMLLICVDTAVRILLAHHIRPDMILSIDSQYWNARHLDNLDIKGIPYVIDSAVHPLLWRTIEEHQRYLISPIVPLMQPLSQQLKPWGALRSGGSVTISAWDLALQMQATSIWLVGADFAYPQAETHAKGALFEQWIVANHTRTQSILSQQLRLKHQQEISLKDNQGKEVASDARMRLYVQWLEEALAQETIPTYNLSAIGAKIHGAPYATVARALELPIIREKIEQTHRKIAQTRIADDPAFIPQLQHYQQEALRLLADLLQRLDADKSNAQPLSHHPACALFSPILPYWLHCLTESAQKRQTLCKRLHAMHQLYGYLSAHK